MPIHIQWFDESHTIIMHIYEEPWTISDYKALLKENHRLIEEAEHIVHVINDLRKLEQLPDDMIPALQEAVKFIHPNEGIKVMVAADTLTQILIESAYSTMGRNPSTINFVETIEEAIQIINSQSNRHIPYETANSNYQ